MLVQRPLLILAGVIAGSLAASAHAEVADATAAARSMTAPILMAQAAPAEASPAPATPGEPAAAATAASIWDGVFTEEQVARGKTAYTQSCGQCHSGSLRGSPGTPGLIGRAFARTWESVTVDGFYLFIRENMPAGQPRSLSDQQYTDIVSYILSRNGFPTGASELPPDEAAMGQITITLTEP